MSFATRLLLPRTGVIGTLSASASLSSAPTFCYQHSLLHTRSLLSGTSASSRPFLSILSPSVPSLSSTRSFASSSSSSRRPAISLNSLSDNPGAKRPRIRWGRGVGSGKGKTAGRGHKGSHARNASTPKPWFIGGQTPLYRLFPKRGFKQRNKRTLTTLNLNTLQQFIQQQRIDHTQPITMHTLLHSGAVGPSIPHGVKLLASGYHTAKGSAVLPALRIEVSDASESAKRAVEEAGGSVKLVWYNRLGLRYLLKPDKFERPPRREAVPPPKYRRKYEEQQVGGERVRSKMGDMLQSRG